MFGKYEKFMPSKGEVFPSLNTNNKKWFTKNSYHWLIFVDIQEHNSFLVVYRDIFCCMLAATL